jgi:hypothetical protein
MQYDTNQNMKLIIKTNISGETEISGDVLLTIENYLGPTSHLKQHGNLIINKHFYIISSTTYEFINNKPILTLYVYDKTLIRKS